LKIARVSFLNAECADDTGCVRHDTYEYCAPSSTDVHESYDAEGRVWECFFFGTDLVHEQLD